MVHAVKKYDKKVEARRDHLKKLKESLGDHSTDKHARQVSLRGDSGGAEVKHHPGIAVIALLLFVVKKLEDGDTGGDHIFRHHDKDIVALGYSNPSTGADLYSSGDTFGFSGDDVSASGDMGSSGDSGSIEYFTTTTPFSNMSDDDFIRNDTGEYSSNLTYAIINMADKFQQDANTGELLSLAPPDCASVELTGLANADQLQEVAYEPADIAGVPYQYYVNPTQLFAAVYKLHFQEPPCHDVFNLESEAKNLWTLSAKHPSFGTAKLQPTDTPPFTIAPCQTVGVHALIRQTEDGVVDLGDDGLLVAPVIEAVPVLIKLSKYNKYNQLCSTHGDYFKVEVVGAMKKKFKASFAVKHKLKSLCPTSSESIESLIDSVASSSSTDRKKHHDAARPQALEDDEAIGEAEGYDLFYKNDCIKAEHAKTKSCTGETLIHIIVEPINPDEDSTSDPTPTSQRGPDSKEGADGVFPGI